jgi:prepilin-type N-terminal cleavage/methylation domain-containing protein
MWKLKQLIGQTTKTRRELTGFTLAETMIVVVIIGVLAAIATPSWIGFVETRRLGVAQDQIYRAMREAQSNAKRDKITWQASFRENDGVVQWAIHPVDPNQFVPTSANWNSLDSSVQIYKDANNLNQCETTLNQPNTGCPAIGPWRVQFDYKGRPKGGLSELGQITLNNKNGGKAQRCVYVATILGAMRTGQDHSTANSKDRYCY